MAASPIASTSAVPMHVCTPQEGVRAPRQRATSPPTPDAEGDADRFYGQKEMAHLCEHVISSLFDISTTFPGLPPTPPMSPSGQEPPHLVEFIAYALYRTRLPEAVVHHALFLLSRLKARYPSARGTASSPHRLFLSSLMLSSKINMDDTYSNRSWTIVGGHFFALKEVNQMERELFAFLGWNVVVRSDDLAMFVKRIESDYAASKMHGGRKRMSITQLLPSLGAIGPAATPPLSPPPEGERAKRSRRDSSCPRSQAAEAAAIALLRPRSQSRRGPFASRASSSDSSPVSSVPSSTFASPRSTSSPVTPISPRTPERDQRVAKSWSQVPMVYRAAAFVPAA